ncbi:UDP-N-acetylglucosamine 2-epimerase (non-hydrolyzing) [Rhizomicrobium palustre]
MIQQVFDLFALKPDIDLGVMQPNQTLAALTARVLEGMEEVLQRTRPDRVLVHGDTTTTMAASLAAYYGKIPVGHVEAGLRTHDIYAPWPEEVNRRISDSIADRHYAPTSRAAENLRNENIPESGIVVTGNTVIDALFDTMRGPLKDENTLDQLRTHFPFLEAGRRIVLVTCHRRESYGTGFRDICAALEKLARRSDVSIVFPIHRNPNVREVFSVLSDKGNVHLIEPLDYLSFVYVMSRADVVLTDSGGIQEEAPSLGKPVLVMRKVTERPEAVAAGTVRLVGTDTHIILDEVGRLLDDAAAYSAMSAVHNPYGDGKASDRIIASLLEEMPCPIS